MITAQLTQGTISSSSQEAFSLEQKSAIGEKANSKIRYMLCEAFYLLQKKQIKIFSGSKELFMEDAEKKFSKLDKKFQTKYPVYKDLRNKGYVVKTALKFGAEFRVYEKSKKPGKAHAKWLVFTDNDANKNSWQEFSSKNRVAHSTKKKLLLAIVDEESDVLYFEVNWIKP